GYRTSSIIGLAAMVIGALILLTVAHGEVLWRAVLASAFFGISMGQSNTAFIISAQNSVGWALRGITTASINFSRSIGGSIGVAALGTILTTTMASRLIGVSAETQNANALL